MSPEGFVLMAEMIANQKIDVEAILAEVRRGMQGYREAHSEDDGEESGGAL